MDCPSVPASHPLSQYGTFLPYAFLPYVDARDFHICRKN